MQERSNLFVRVSRDKLGEMGEMNKMTEFKSMKGRCFKPCQMFQNRTGYQWIVPEGLCRRDSCSR